MEVKASQALPYVGQPQQPSRRALYLGAFFLLVWPAFNLLIISNVFLQFGIFDAALLSAMALRFFGLFAFAYSLIHIAQRLFPVALAEDRFWPQWLLHLVTIFALATSFGPAARPPELAVLPDTSALPAALAFFQITLYVVVKTLLIQRDQYLAAQLNLRQAQINLLRSQANPHFLFNTLNLLAAEIGRDADTAREIVYDLADLLRDSMRAAEREFTTLGEELRLIELYLALQKKRFPDRLDYEVAVDDDCLSIPVPSLLLQPVVENVIKHVVARSASVTKLVLVASLRQGELEISVKDNGQPLNAKSFEAKSFDATDSDATNFEAKGGLRIVKETLALHYRGRATLQMKSTPEGGRVSLRLPIALVDD